MHQRLISDMFVSGKNKNSRPLISGGAAYAAKFGGLKGHQTRLFLKGIALNKIICILGKIQVLFMLQYDAKKMIFAAGFNFYKGILFMKIKTA